MSALVPDDGPAAPDGPASRLLLARLAAILDATLDPLILLHPLRDAAGEVVDFVIGDMNAPHTHQGGDVSGEPMRLRERSAELFDLYRRVLRTGVTDSLRRVRISSHPDVPGSVGGCADVRATAVEGDLVVSWRSVDGDVAAEDLLRAQADLLRVQAMQDPLTHLPNRRGLMEVLAAVCAAPDPFGVLFVDVDRFKSINDDYGHSVGDAVLVATGRRLAATLRDDDIVGRLAGDEFVVLTRSPRGPDDLRAMAARVLATGDDVHRAGAEEIRVSVSVGGLWVAHRPREADRVLQAADALMYTAKRRGGGRLTMGELAAHPSG